MNAKSVVDISLQFINQLINMEKQKIFTTKWQDAKDGKITKRTFNTVLDGFFLNKRKLGDRTDTLWFTYGRETVVVKKGKRNYLYVELPLKWQDKITPDMITDMKTNELFVFGSNLSGLHGGGAAALAQLKFGAKWGKGEGIMGRSYALPTLGKNFKAFTVKDIEKYVNRMIDCAQKHPELIFLVTEIGCGIAGFKVEEIAPLFNKVIEIDNIHLPVRFWAHINC